MRLASPYPPGEKRGILPSALGAGWVRRNMFYLLVSAPLGEQGQEHPEEMEGEGQTSQGRAGEAAVTMAAPREK